MCDSSVIYIPFKDCITEKYILKLGLKRIFRQLLVAGKAALIDQESHHSTVCGTHKCYCPFSELKCTTHRFILNPCCTIAAQHNTHTHKADLSLKGKLITQTSWPSPRSAYCLFTQ